MNESKKRFLDRLLAADPTSGEARGRYEKEIETMLEKTLIPRQRGAHLVAAVLIALASVVSGWLASTLPPGWEAGKYLSTMLAVTGVALLIVAGLLFRGYWKGVINLPSTRKWAAGVGVVYIGLLGWLFLLMARFIPELLRDDVRIFGLVLLVYAAVAWVRARITQSEMRTAEKLLQIELRLAEMGEALEGRRGTDDPASPHRPPSP